MDTPMITAISLTSSTTLPYTPRDTQINTMNCVRILPRILPLAAQAGANCIKRDVPAPPHMGGCHAIDTRPQARHFHKSLLLRDNNPSSGVPSHPAPEQSAKSKRKPSSGTKSSSNLETSSKSKEMNTQRDKPSGHDQKPSATSSHQSSPQSTSTNPPQSKKFKKSKKPKTKRTPIDSAATWEKRFLEALINFTLHPPKVPFWQRGSAYAKRKASLEPEQTQSSPHSPPTQESADSLEPDEPKESKGKDKSYKKEPLYPTRAEIVQSLRDKFGVTLVDELDSHPVLIKHGLTSQDQAKRKLNGHLWLPTSRAEAIQDLLQADLWGPLIENFTFNRDLAEGWYPGESEWMLGHRMSMLLGTFPERVLRKAGVYEGNVVSMKKLGVFLAGTVDIRHPFDDEDEDEF